MRWFVVRLGTWPPPACSPGGWPWPLVVRLLRRRPRTPRGQPGQSCQAVVANGGTEPGNAASAPGSPFNEPSATSPGGTAGLHYAGNQPQNSKNPKSVAQYDVACFQVSQH
jgi:hypothetical protein